ncbi:MAG: hypothetical protein OEZ01_00745 [Candidatus Heimdallarchaeota archaeon]|nr:hypothetical protein [Candidatus Heimdallarchaeota archaeon]MDH5644500.1 hypothetical protein [Candidatus Heimdallarchaeota archaeon]
MDRLDEDTLKKIAINDLNYKRKIEALSRIKDRSFIKDRILAEFDVRVIVEALNYVNDSDFLKSFVSISSGKGKEKALELLEDPDYFNRIKVESEATDGDLLGIEIDPVKSEELYNSYITTNYTKFKEKYISQISDQNILIKLLEYEKDFTLRIKLKEKIKNQEIIFTYIKNIENPENIKLDLVHNLKDDKLIYDLLLLKHIPYKIQYHLSRKLNTNEYLISIFEDDSFDKIIKENALMGITDKKYLITKYNEGLISGDAYIEIYFHRIRDDDFYEEIVRNKNRSAKDRLDSIEKIQNTKTIEELLELLRLENLLPIDLQRLELLIKIKKIETKPFVTLPEGYYDNSEVDNLIEQLENMYDKNEVEQLLKPISRKIDFVKLALSSNSHGVKFACDKLRDDQELLKNIFILTDKIWNLPYVVQHINDVEFLEQIIHSGKFYSTQLKCSALRNISDQNYLKNIVNRASLYISYGLGMEVIIETAFLKIDDVAFIKDYILNVDRHPNLEGYDIEQSQDNLILDNIIASYKTDVELTKNHLNQINNLELLEVIGYYIGDNYKDVILHRIQSK